MNYFIPMKISLIPAIVLLSAIHAAADFERLVRNGDVHDAKFQFDKALEYYLPAEKLAPDNAALLVKISKQYALRMKDLPEKADKIASVRQGLAYAERARTSAPAESDSHLGVAIRLGKLTPFLGAREKDDPETKQRGRASLKAIS